MNKKRDERNYYIDKLAQLRTGKIKPKAIIGTGYRNPREVAERWLAEQIARFSQ